MEALSRAQNSLQRAVADLRQTYPTSYVPPTYSEKKLAAFTLDDDEPSVILSRQSLSVSLLNWLCLMCNRRMPRSFIVL
jgi:hypothetical protein